MRTDDIIKCPWSKADQVMLDELLRRKQEWDALNKGPVEKIASALVARASVNTESVTVVFEYLTDNADAIRDALAPFDSGVRVQEEM